MEGVYVAWKGITLLSLRFMLLLTIRTLVRTTSSSQVALALELGVGEVMARGNAS